jgi:hypothetical protein
MEEDGEELERVEMDEPLLEGLLAAGSVKRGGRWHDALKNAVMIAAVGKVAVGEEVGVSSSAGDDHVWYRVLGFGVMRIAPSVEICCVLVLTRK